jgi:hypothetical protein
MTEIETEPLQDDDQTGSADGLGLSNWLLRPWYAKLWWAAIPVYWLAMGEPTRPEFLNAFADSGYAVVTNIIFVPITALFALGVGFFRQAAIDGWLEPLPAYQMKPISWSPEETGWYSTLNPNRFRNEIIRKHMNHH